MAAPFTYVLSGSTDRSKPVVVFLHGFLGCSSDWEEIAASLADDFRALLIDLPGHGGNLVCNNDDAYTIDSNARGLVKLFDNLGIAKAHVIGYSMGGRLALYFLIAYPERCDRVILESTSPGLRTDAECTARRRYDEQLAQRLERDGVEAFVHYWYEQRLFETMIGYPERFQRLLDRRRHNDSTGLARSLRMMGTGVQPSLWPQLSEINSPLLLLAGKKDHKFTALAGEMADLCPTAEVRIIEPCGHNVHFEQPERFAQEVRSFLQDVR